MNQSIYLVVGLGKTGRSIAHYLRRRNKPFVVFDTRQEPDGLADFNQEFPEVDVFLGDFPTTVYERLVAIIASPGVSLDEPVLQEAMRRNISIIGDIECLAQEIKAPVIAITGTNGKSTVTTLVGEMAKAAGLSVAVAGNIGLPVLDLLDDDHHYDLWVLELSSFQLELTHSLKPIAATILNISIDHLDRHHNLLAYIQAKQRVYRHAQLCLYNREDEQTRPQLKLLDEQPYVISYGLNKPDEGHWGLLVNEGHYYLAEGETCMLPVDALRIKGRHNWQNALAASALATAAGIKPQVINAVLQSFEGLPHRCQWVRTLDQVDWINDSKGTNVGATLSAISGIGSSVQGKIILIAGGIGKGADFTELRASVEHYVRSVILIGEDADKIQIALSDVTAVLRALTLDDAIQLAQSQARAGDVVLLSPACASFDMFRDFNHRGESFTKGVNQL